MLIKRTRNNMNCQILMKKKIIQIKKHSNKNYNNFNKKKKCYKKNQKITQNKKKPSQNKIILLNKIKKN